MSSKNRVVRVSEEELALLTQLRASKEDLPVVEASDDKISAQKELANALADAIRLTQPKPKKSLEDVAKQNPWYPKDGSPRAKKKRAFFHHGVLIGENITNTEIELLNKVKPGSYCEGFVRVTLRKDRGIDIDYPVKTASQRLKLVNQFGIRSFAELLQRLIDEHADPRKYRKAEDADLYDDQD